jgi:acyl-CoA thioesterase FadM
MKLTENYIAAIAAGIRTIPDYMKAMEEAGLAHMAASGHRLEDLWARGESMMFSRAGIRLFRTDLEPDRVVTRIASAKGVRAQRHFRFYAGDVLTAEAMNESFCVKMDTHQVFRSDWFRLDGPAMETDFALRRLPAPKETGRCTGTYEVTETDYNGHLHNTDYWVYALRALPETAMPKEMHLQFHREILPGSPFRTYVFPDGRTVAGRQNGEIAFVAVAEW